MALLPILEFPTTQLNLAVLVDPARPVDRRSSACSTITFETMYAAPASWPPAIDVHQRFMVIDVSEEKDRRWCS